jgi:hypothetical protein
MRHLRRTRAQVHVDDLGETAGDLLLSHLGFVLKRTAEEQDAFELLSVGNDGQARR